ETVAAHDALPFSWGASDCMTFAADAAAAQTGKNPYPRSRRLKTALGARRAMKRRGFASYGDALASRFPEIAPALARVGDLCIVPNEAGGETCGVVLGADVAARDLARLARLPRSRILRAFRVE
ncbi:MAG TPA: hypothetical protein VM434_05080, partial [Beijerinckiaceae bacterium]|nr:hypothetical protein [Beijerinckiaceae bacterium]